MPNCYFLINLTDIFRIQYIYFVIHFSILTEYSKRVGWKPSEDPTLMTLSTADHNVDSSVANVDLKHISSSKIFMKEERKIILVLNAD